MIKLIIICSFILSISFTAGIAPKPHCISHPVTLESPLSNDEKITLHLDNAFSGYNLQFSITSNTSVARLTPKFSMIDSASGYFPRIIEQHVQHDGNKWGKQSFILYRNSSSIVFQFASNFSSSKVPTFSFTTIVETNPSVNCFGAALLLDYGIAIVDCMKTITVQEEVNLQNLFYYIDLTSGNITKIVKNSMFTPYNTVTSRKFIKFHDPHTGFQYILRGYISNGMTKAFRGNTYFQIFSVFDPYNIQIMKVVDRSYLQIKTFQIVDIKIYLGDIFVLDPVYGLFRLDILGTNEVVIIGRFEKQGFNRFSVYSDDLQQQVIIALANSHAVYEIQWSDMSKPLTLTKYSLIQHSYIKQLIINKDFVIVQSSANATNQANSNFQIDYTWIFTKGTRTYTNAYKVINHSSSSVALDFNKDTNRLYVVDQKGRYLYQLSEPQIILELKEQTLIGKSQDLIITAISNDPNSDNPMMCHVKTKINYVRPEDQTIYNSNYETTKVYSTNNPGLLRINLDNYVLGPNITYSIINQQSEYQMPVRWIDKINFTKIEMQTQIGNVTFFHTTVVPQFGQQRIYYYVQDSSFQTHIIQCIHLADNNVMTCQQVAKFPHDSQITTFTDAYFIDSQDWEYFYIMVFQNNLKQIKIYDFIFHSNNWTIQYQGQQQAQVTSIASSNGFLYVLRGAVKTIDVYKLTQCKIEKCQIHFQINAEMMKTLGVRYFTPLQIITDYNHPQVLFLKSQGSIIIIDVDNKQKITVLDQIIQTSTSNKNYKIAINKYKLTIISNPNIIHIYSLQNLYDKNQVIFQRKLSIYNYIIQNNFDVQFSDFNDLVYINVVHPNKNVSVILVYKTSRPAALALYTQIQLPKLYTKSQIQIQISGFYVDYVNIKTNDGFTLYRVFQQPAAIIENVYLDYKFQLSFMNTQSTLITQQLQVISVNYPKGFNSTNELNKTLDNLKLDKLGNYTWDDRKWFVGHITGYNSTCEQCGQQGSIVHIQQHVEKTKSLNFPAYDYAETITGGVAVLEDLFRFHINGSIADVINLPDQKQHQKCNRVAAAYHSDIIVSACQQLGLGVNLYITSQIPTKPWTWGPYKSQSSRVKNLQIAGDIVMLTDSTDHPEYKFIKGAIYLYSLDLDIESGDQMVQLQVIDETDLINSIGYKKDQVFISNSHLVFSWNTSTYRLYVAEVDGGFFVVDFSHEIGRGEINVISTYYIDMITLLEKNNLHMPMDASFMAITLSNYKYNPHFYMESVIITTKRYHNFEVTLVFDDDGKLLSQMLHRVYQSYGYYVATNDVKSSSGYVAMAYVLPYTYPIGNSSRQIVAVYDTNDYEDDHEKGYSERYILGAARFNKTNTLMFSFNTTYDFTTNGTKTGLVITYPSDIQNIDMWEESISRNLTLQLQKGFKEQKVTFTAYSDFEAKNFTMYLISPQPDPQPNNNKILIIIIIIVGTLIVIGLIIYFIIFIKKRKSINKKAAMATLITDEESPEISVQPSPGSYQPPNQLHENSDSDYSQKDEQAHPVLYVKPNEQTQEIMQEQFQAENRQKGPYQHRVPIEDQKTQN